MADEWNLNVPDNDELVSDLPGEHRERKTNVKTVLEKEHTTLGDGNSGGLHKQGSARAFFQDAAPATNVDGSAFGAGDLGLLWIDSNASPDNQFNILTATTPTWTPISTEIIAVLLAANRQFAGNIIVDGKLDVAGNIDPTTYETTNGGFLDEDAMGSDAADKVASQQSIKAYVDADHPAYSGGESHTDGSGLIIKVGKTAVSTGDTITFGTAFPNAIIAVVPGLETASASKTVTFTSASAASFVAHHNVGAAANVSWTAIGY